MAEVKDENGRKERFYLYYDGESVAGKVNVTLHRKTGGNFFFQGVTLTWDKSLPRQNLALIELWPPGKIEHHGIKIEFVGQIELYYDRGNHYEFLSLVKELARPGELTQNTSYDFEFAQVTFVNFYTIAAW